jgi:hypothetical protein
LEVYREEENEFVSRFRSGDFIVLFLGNNAFGGRVNQRMWRFGDVASRGGI